MGICAINGGGMMRYLFFSLLFALLVAIFAMQNSLPVVVSFMNWSFATSLVIIILGSATFGALMILSLASLVQFRLQRHLQQTQQENTALQAEISILQSRLEQELAKDLTKNDL
jgi:lipopolysaccharide assembly protein A